VNQRASAISDRVDVISVLIARPVKPSISELGNGHG
jgi:hypothetical protein